MCRPAWYRPLAPIYRPSWWRPPFINHHDGHRPWWNPRPHGWAGGHIPGGWRPGHRPDNWAAKPCKHSLSLYISNLHNKSALTTALAHRLTSLCCGTELVQALIHMSSACVLPLPCCCPPAWKPPSGWRPDQHQHVSPIWQPSRNPGALAPNPGADKCC
jgi:hypothetical protein